jgi:hypothetical protein
MILEAYYLFMTIGGLVISYAMMRFLKLFTPPVRGWWMLATSLRLLTGSLLAQGMRLVLIYGLRLLGVDLAVLDRVISAGLTAVSAVSAVFFLKGYLKHREFGPGAGRTSSRQPQPQPE